MDVLKSTIAVFVLLAISFVCKADNPSGLQRMPEFPGGEKAMYEFMRDNIHYPQDAVRDSIEGLVIVQFVVDEDGSINDVIPARSPNLSLGDEAVRMIKSMPKWTPGLKDDKPVKVYLTLPVKFRLDDDMHVFHIDDVEVKPEFPGGDRAMCEFIVKNIRHLMAQQLDICGTAVVRFTIEKDGSITGLKTVRSPHEMLTEEAERLVMSMPAWTPGKQNGQPVRVSYTLPVPFKVFRSDVTLDGMIEAIAASIAAYEPVYELDDLDIHPEFPGGLRAMFDFMVKNIKYPEENPEVHTQGTVVVQFVVGEDGALTNAQILYSDHAKFSNEVLRVVGLMPAWTPGQKDGKPVKARYLLPARFKSPEW